MGKCGGVKTKLTKRIAHLKWLIYSSSPLPAWTTTNVLQAEFDF